jgi:hypothetical protein
MPPPSQSRFYPQPLRDAEFRRLRARRAIHGLRFDGTECLPDDAVGFALSGGGIRSATMCLGVFQRLAQGKLLKRIDYISTVSGGGYFGSFLGAWFDRGRSALSHRWRRWPTPFAPMVEWAADKVSATLAQWTAGKAPTAEKPRMHHSFHILQSAFHRPAAPATTSNTHFTHVEEGLADLGSFPNYWLRENGRFLAPNGAGDLLAALAVALRSWVSIHVILTTFFLLLLTVAQKLPVWLLHWSQDSSPAPDDDRFEFVMSQYAWLAVAIGGLAVLCGFAYWLFSSSARLRNRLTHWLTCCLIASLALLAYALVDSLGATLYFNRDWLLAWIKGWYLQTGGSLAVAVLVGRRIQSILEGLSARDRLSVPMSFLTAAVAVGLALVWLVALSVGSYVLNDWAFAGYASPWMVLLALSLFFALWPRFLNLSSQASLYETRLTRAYLGASNPARPKNQRLSDTIPGDIVPFSTYAPDAVGGPLHLINVTVNETVDGRSQVEQRDRKGFPLVLGPCGLSAAVSHHACWTDENQRDEIRPIDNGGFNCLAGQPGRPVSTMQFSLGGWTAISGAAFTTGLGAHTNMGLSFLLGFFNVRLGRWWDSGVESLARHHHWWTWLRAVPATVFPVQLQLLNEFFARFHGSSRRYWYLSDGGHFENSGAYELIRRRVPLIVICDSGCDPARMFDDLASLVRKARVDFGTEIMILDAQDLDRCVQPLLRRHIGSFSELQTDPATGLSAKHALLARVDYRDPDQRGWILLLKPSLTGDEPADVLNYWQANKDFPQQSTTDQFFDEAQWESYRRLGEHICETILGSADPDRPLRDSLLQVP